MRAIEAAIADADVGAIVISGPAGVGKSRVAREALDWAASKGYETRWAVDAHLLLRAAQGAVWLAYLPLADRLADAAIRAGAGSEANFVRATRMRASDKAAKAARPRLG